MRLKRKEQCDQKEIPSIKTSSESHLHWKNPFHKNLSVFRIIAVFEADKENDISSVGNKTTWHH